MSETRIPEPTERWRCAHCGNLTRFDVVRRARVSEYWHLSMSGEPTVEETEVLDGAVERVVCRWCGSGDRIEIVPRPEFGGPESEER